jgi:putative SOS response-associated peptidase YedK
LLAISYAYPYLPSHKNYPMCGRYSLAAKAEKLVKRFNVDVTAAYSPKYNAAPTQLLPVITGENPDGFSFFYWGIVPAWSNNRAISPKLINARAETLAERASFKGAFHNRRCLVPADGFYEWKQIGKKTKIPYRFILSNESPFAFAGIWDEFENLEGEQVQTFTLITTQANELVTPIHDRMPVILTPESEKIWLDKNSTPRQLLDVLKPYSEDEMANYTVSPKVNNAMNEGPELILHVPPADQFGNFTLFS